MGSFLEELARREAAVRRRVEQTREEIAELERRLGAEEEQLSRVVIAREVAEEILGETARLAGAELEPARVRPDGSPIGVSTVPTWEPGMTPAVLPRAYRDVMEVITDAGHGLRSKQIALALGLGDSASTVEGLRGKLRRLVSRGWLRQDSPGIFALVDQASSVREG
ncbi:hypothetical protein [Acrocarpospora corrugata]|uniref:hypothetical protein n=2 Tax=Acrocarpospora corrugata TaxID=35763 RepID=UPI0031D1E0AD